MSFAKIRPRRGTANQWSNANPILAEGEIGIEVPSTGVGTGNVKIKFGDGSTHWNDLPYGLDNSNASSSDIISDEFIAGTPCTSGNYYIADNKLYKCIADTDGSVNVTNSNYFKNTTVGAELASKKSNKSFEEIATATKDGNVTTTKPLSEFNGFIFMLTTDVGPYHNAVLQTTFVTREIFEMKGTNLFVTNETGKVMGRVRRVDDNTLNFFNFKEVKKAYLIGFY